MLAEDLQEKAIAYLMGDMDAVEKASFESLLNEDAALREYVDELEGLDLELSLASTPPQTPPESLRDRILDSLPEKTNASASNKPPAPSPSSMPRFPFVAVLGWAAAACFCVLFIRTDSRLTIVEEQADSGRAQNEALSTRIDRLQANIDEISKERDLIAKDLSELKEKSALDQIQIARLNSELDSLYFGFTVWDGQSEEGVVRVYNLPTLDIELQDYQMWVISPDQPAPISAGVFQVDQSGNGEYRFSSNIQISDVNAFAISREQKGGSPSPLGPILLSGSP